MNRLYSRLLFSYILTVVVTLMVIGGALLLLWHSRPVPAGNLYQRLGDIARGAALRLAEEAENSERLDPAQALAVLRRIAETSELRLLVISEDPKHVLFDSREKIPRDQPVPDYQINPQHSQPPMVAGSFTDPEDKLTWLFIGWPFEPDRPRPDFLPPRPKDRLILLAIPMPQPSLSVTLQNFGEEIVVPMIQAGMVGVFVSVVLAALIARSVAKPLQQTAQAAQAVADGHLDQQLPEEGPTEVQTLARSFNHMTNAVKASQQTQRDFVANVSHDLRTPLTVIQGFSQAILDSATESPERAATVIHDEAARMSRMVQDLLDLARLESGQLQMTYAQVNPELLLQTVAGRFALYAESQNIMLKIDIDDDLPVITGDGDRLAQVLTNLVDNALKHTPAGGTVTLSGTYVEQNGAVELAVSDTGKGIPQEDLSRIFERFYQVDKARTRDKHRKGAGLGLAISKEIVSAHGGSIHAESVVGLGSRFVVRLPTSRETASGGQ